jgi:hypothetical protein
MCKACSLGNCRELPVAPNPPNAIECPICDGAGCSHCQHGELPITICPKLEIGRELHECLHYAELYRKGTPLVAGGSLEQPRWFNAFSLALWDEDDRFSPQPGN